MLFQQRLSVEQGQLGTELRHCLFRIQSPITTKQSCRRPRVIECIFVKRTPTAFIRSNSLNCILLEGACSKTGVRVFLAQTFRAPAGVLDELQE